MKGFFTGTMIRREMHEGPINRSSLHMIHIYHD